LVELGQDVVVWLGGVVEEQRHDFLLEAEPALVAGQFGALEEETVEAEGAEGGQQLLGDDLLVEGAGGGQSGEHVEDPVCGEEAGLPLEGRLAEEAFEDEIHEAIEYILLQMRLKNPTKHFYEQAEAPDPRFRPEIEAFVHELTNLTRCGLCRSDYDLGAHLPRILIHCGHTLCSCCLQAFFKRGKVRCPFCLKLVKKLDGVDILPVNHTVFRRLVEAHNRSAEDKINAEQELFNLFDYSQKQRAENQQIDKESGLPYCVVHNDRVEHFFCEFHKTLACRACCEASHINPECKIVELYELPDPQQYLLEQGMFE
jgi:hypothetical protein